MAYWAVARVEPRREAVAQHFLRLAGFEVYVPRFCEWRLCNGRRVGRVRPLFPSYVFFVIEQQWYAARWAIGVTALIMGDQRPARVPDAVIAGLKSRERADGLIELPKPAGLRRGDPVRIVRGPLVGQLAFFDGMKSRERCKILFALLGGQQRVTVAKQDVEAVL